jgi:hypothetical protein
MMINPWKLSSYKPGRTILCIVTRVEEGGRCTVLLCGDSVQGHMYTNEKLQKGQEVLARFVCQRGNCLKLAYVSSARADYLTSGFSEQTEPALVPASSVQPQMAVAC